MSKYPGGVGNVDVSRIAKHAVLLTFAIATIFAIFISYTNYAFRRSIDDKIASIDKDQTIELISYESGNVAKAVREIENLRCAQRDSIAFYRLSTLHLMSGLSRVYSITWDQRMDLQKFLKENHFVDQDALKKEFSGIWGIPIPSEIKLKQDLSRDDTKRFYEELSSKLAELSKAVEKRLENGEDRKAVDDLFKSTDAPAAGDDKLGLFEKVERSIRKARALESEVFFSVGIDPLEARIMSLGRDVDKTKGALERWKSIFAQKWAAESAFRSFMSKSGSAQHAQGDPRTFGLTLGSVNCANTEVEVLRYVSDRLGKFLDREKYSDKEKLQFATLIQRMEKALPEVEKVEANEGFLFDGLISPYMSLPASMQALVVTILFGFLGGLTVNLLRLSYVGYWGLSPDPDWGDIVISPLVGAIAATIIFLLSAIGLPLLTDTRNGVNTGVSAAVVGFLGFVSGFLNREAFAQVKIMGLKMFGQKTGTGEFVNVTEFDTELAEKLKKVGATRFAELTVLHGLAEQMFKSVGTRFLIPSDDHFNGMKASSWFELAEGAGRSKVLQLLNDLTLVGISDLKTLTNGQVVSTASGKSFTAAIATTGAVRKVTLGAATFDPNESFNWREREFVVIPTLP